jgi:hypothetical protein
MPCRPKWLHACVPAAVSFGLFALLSGRPEGTVGPTIPADGTLTMGLTAAGAVERKRTLFARYDAGSVPFADPLLAAGDFDAASGSGSDTAADTTPLMTIAWAPEETPMMPISTWILMVTLLRCSVLSTEWICGLKNFLPP